jgi:hypothetical protein
MKKLLLAGLLQQVQLVGEWTNCRQEFKRLRRTAPGVKTEEVSFHTFNFCPTITFRSNGTGQVTTAGGREAFTWQQTNDKLAVQMLNANPSSFWLSSDSYSLNVRATPAPLITQMIALTNKKGDSYILAR